MPGAGRRAGSRFSAGNGTGETTLDRLNLLDRLVLGLARRRFSLGRFGFEDALIRMIQRDYEAPSYRRLQRLGFAPATVFDIGANKGNWSRAFRKDFPECRIVMFEAQEELEPLLAEACREMGNAACHLCLLSDRPQEAVEFFAMGTGSSIRPERSNVERSVRRLPTVTLDAILEREGNIAQPLFVKIDVQGAELDILRGAPETLRQAEWVQLETALLGYNEGAPQIREVIGFMADAGFLATEITGFARPKDHLVQIDLLFARDGSALRPSSFSF